MFRWAKGAIAVMLAATPVEDQHKVGTEAPVESVTAERSAGDDSAYAAHTAMTEGQQVHVLEAPEVLLPPVDKKYSVLPNDDCRADVTLRIFYSVPLLYACYCRAEQRGVDLQNARRLLDTYADLRWWVSQQQGDWRDAFARAEQMKITCEREPYLCTQDVWHVAVQKGYHVANELPTWREFFEKTVVPLGERNKVYMSWQLLGDREYTLPHMERILALDSVRMERRPGTNLFFPQPSLDR